MFELRPLSPAAIPAALAKAERYRLLNDSGQAESICQDVLAIDPDNQDALAMMILAITDQFKDEGTDAHVGRAERLVPGLHDAYTQAYYGAIINERRARAALDAGRATMAYEWLLGALHGFDRAIGLRPGGNDDAVLRWNACVRALQRLPAPSPADRAESAIMSE
jgi:tetratricopeptide (TPR) repeat protein